MSSIPASELREPISAEVAQVKLPAVFYVLICLQTLVILAVAALAYRSWLGPAAGEPSRPAVETAEPLTEQAELEPELRPETDAEPSQPEPASPGLELPPSPDFSRVVGSPRLDLRDGGTLRGSPALLRGSAPYGERVALLIDGEPAEDAAVQDGRFEFRELELPAGQHRLSVVAYSQEGPAVESPGVSVRYQP